MRGGLGHNPKVGSETVENARVSSRIAPNKAIDAPSLEVLAGWSNLVYWKLSLAGNWIEVVFTVTSKPNHTIL